MKSNNELNHVLSMYDRQTDTGLMASFPRQLW